MEFLASFHREGKNWTFISTQEGRETLDLVDYAKHIDGCRCDICNKRIARNDIYLVKDEGNIKQIGYNCYNGNDEVATALSTYKTQEAFDSWWGYQRTYNVGNFGLLNTIYQVHKKYGFNKMSLSAFKDFVKENNIVGNKDDEPTIKEIVNFLIKKLENTKNEFKYNLYAVLNNKTFTSDKFGLLQYTFKLYDDIKIQEANKENLNKKLYLGDNFVVKTIRFMNKEEREYGYRNFVDTYRYIIITENGEVLDVSTSNKIDEEAIIGKTYVASVKRYKGNIEEDEEAIKHYDSDIYGVVTKVNRLKEVV